MKNLNLLNVQEMTQAEMGTTVGGYSFKEFMSHVEMVENAFLSVLKAFPDVCKAAVAGLDGITAVRNAGATAFGAKA